MMLLPYEVNDIIDDGVEYGSFNCSCFSDDDIFVSGEDACWSDVGVRWQGTAGEVVTGERYSEGIPCTLHGDSAIKCTQMRTFYEMGCTFHGDYTIKCAQMRTFYETFLGLV